MYKKNNMEQIENIKWTAIPGCDDYYISDQGQVLSKKMKTPRIIKHCTDNNQKNKPFFVKIRVNGKCELFLVSLLMAMTFIENPNKYTFIKYLDGNKINYDMTNLEWNDNPYSSTDTWEVLKNFPMYEICENGVRNIVTKKELKPKININGYPAFQLSKNGHIGSTLIHVLIAIQYIPNPLNLPEVNHIDRNKMHYAISNLAWVTGKQNSQHACDTKLNKENVSKGKHVELLNEDYQVINTFTSIRKASVFIGKSYAAVKNKLNKHLDVNGTVVING